MKTPLILGINGSPHQDGIVSELLSLVLDGAKTQAINLYSLKITHEPGLYSEDPAKATPEHMPPDDIVDLYPLIEQADALVLATPTYWANMSGIMKDFIDHLTPLENDGFRLEGKIAAFIAASRQNEGGIEMAAMSMVAALAQMGVLIPPNAILWHPGDWHTAAGEHDSWAKSGAPKLGKSMVELSRLLDQNPIEWS